MLSLAAEARDDVTGEHCQRIQQLTYLISRELGLTKKDAEAYGFFSMMHDVGKIHIPDHILNKKGPLTQDERRIMQGHTVAGEKILGQSSYYEIARQIARSHHEWMDGSGYPDGLAGTQIPLSAKIVAIADVFDALITPRPYKKAWPIKQALEEIRQLTNRQFDRQIVNAFEHVVNAYLNILGLEF